MIWTCFLFFSAAYYINYFVFEKNGDYAWNRHTVFNHVLWLLFPFVYLMLLYAYRVQLARCRWLTDFGALALPIYLFSPLIGYAAWHIGASCGIGLGILPLLLSQIIILAAAYVMSKCLYKYDSLRKVFFPRGWSDWTSWLSNGVLNKRGHLEK